MGEEGFTPAAGSPRWFLDNLARPGESRRVDYAGGHVHFLGWNWDRPELPPLLLVHGFSGHARWWSFLAPFFADRYRIAAVDLPGMGDSAGLPRYDEESYARGLLAVIEAERLPPVTIIGHSFGGLQTLRAMTLAPGSFRHGIVVDSMMRLPPAPPLPVFTPRGVHRYSASREECLARFRLVPDQPEALEPLLQFVAFHSCRRDEQGWRWKFDANVCNVGELTDLEGLSAITARVDCIYGEESLFNSDDRPHRLLGYLGNPGEAVLVPGAYHHLMLDHPLELVAAIDRLLAATPG